MTKNKKTPRSMSKHSAKTVTTKAGTAHTVTPTSERIIKETSVKRRKAMKVLANR